MVSGQRERPLYRLVTKGTERNGAEPERCRLKQQVLGGVPHFKVSVPPAAGVAVLHCGAGVDGSENEHCGCRTHGFLPPRRPLELIAAVP